MIRDSASALAAGHVVRSTAWHRQGGVVVQYRDPPNVPLLQRRGRGVFEGEERALDLKQPGKNLLETQCCVIPEIT